MRLVPAVLLAALLLAGCAGSPSLTPPDAASRIDVATPELAALKRQAGIEDCPRVSGEHADLPDVTLPCLGGGPEVALRSIQGPAVVAVWAQWCGPCRRELPWYQRLHERAGPRLTVLGIDWQDTQPGRALELAQLTGVTFPSVADLDAEVADGGRGLPLAYFIDADGAVTPKRGELQGYAELVDLVADHTGVVVAAG